MAKYKDGNYLQLRREIFGEEYKKLSVGAKWLYVVLNELEHRYTSGTEGSPDCFYRSNADLASDAGMSVATIKRHKKELVSAGLIQEWKSHFTNEKTGKRSEERVTMYRLIK